MVDPFRSENIAAIVVVTVILAGIVWLGKVVISFIISYFWWLIGIAVVILIVRKGDDASKMIQNFYGVIEALFKPIGQFLKWLITPV